MHLLHWAQEYRKELLSWKARGTLTPSGQIELDNISTVLEEIYNQQSEELKVIE